MNHLGDYDVIVIGAGHAGIEAAHAAATLGSLLSLLIGGVILDYFGVTVLLLVGAATLLCGSAIVFRFALPARLAQKR